eukprot:scaffold138699_cov31-Tisochrysis_lutea.AAC.4
MGVDLLACWALCFTCMLGLVPRNGMKLSCSTLRHRTQRNRRAMCREWAVLDHTYAACTTSKLGGGRRLITPPDQVPCTPYALVTYMCEVGVRRVNETDRRNLFGWRASGGGTRSVWCKYIARGGWEWYVRGSLCAAPWLTVVWRAWASA